MDREVERFIRAAIAGRFPGDAIIGEEEGGVPKAAAVAHRPDRRHRELRARQPHYCVSIGYLEAACRRWA